MTGSTVCARVSAKRSSPATLTDAAVLSTELGVLVAITVTGSSVATAFDCAKTPELKATMHKAMGDLLKFGLIILISLID
jgi:hypothetical protein